MNSSGERPLVLPFASVARDDVAMVGGKGANLGELARAGFRVPEGFCVTTAGYDAFLAAAPEQERRRLLDALEAIEPTSVSEARSAGGALRQAMAEWPVPAEVADALLRAWRDAGTEQAYAVRSSATAEDLPGASFAGQQETFLNVRGQDALLEAVRGCWISLFTDRAILYRSKNGFAHRAVKLSVVVQRMVQPEASGILFTADPMTGHRHIASIDAGFGLGEALVAGTITADLYRVDARSGQVLEARVGHKGHAVRALAEGGTVEQPLDEARAASRVLDDRQARALAAMGRRAADHFGAPQDIEWAIDPEGTIHVLQSRPITTLFPLPEPRPEDPALHVYFSFSHAQVMTDAMSALGRSVWRTIIPFGKKDPTALSSVLCHAGGRLYVDITPMLRLAPMRHLLPRMLSVADARSAAAIEAVAGRDELLAGVAQARPRVTVGDLVRTVAPMVARAVGRLAVGDPDRAIADVEAVTETRVAAMRARLAAAETGAPRLRAARLELSELFGNLVLRLFPIIAAGMLARLVLRRLVAGRVEAGAVEDLLRGLEGNVTTEMDLSVGDLADLARRHPAVARMLRAAREEDREPAALLADLEDVEGGPELLVAWRAFMRRFGDRGPSEIDIARPRWREDARSLLTMIVGRMQGPELGPAAHRDHFARMRAEGEAMVERLAEAARHGPLGALRARLARRMARVARGTFAAREHPKFALVRMFASVKEASLEAGDQLVRAGRLQERKDVFHLRLGELIAVLEDPGEDPRSLVAQRRAELSRFAQLRPPRVLTSDGEMPETRLARGDAPDGALTGSAASGGVVEGVARVVHDPATELLSPGEILVAPFTDPGWTPLFLSAAALVMEVGGLMTHGSVVAREYGIPAVVGVEGATTSIATGQRLRVDGDRGWVQIVDEGSS